MSEVEVYASFDDVKMADAGSHRDQSEEEQAFRGWTAGSGS